MKKLIVICLAALITAVGTTGSAASETVQLEVAAGHCWGDSTYEIGGLNKISGNWTFAHFPVSRLEFPMDFNLATVSAGVNPTDRIHVQAILGRNVSDPVGPMKDSDWGISGFAGASPLEKDIYSETDADLAATTATLDIRYDLASSARITLSAGTGYRYQHLNYECGNGLQAYPSTGLSPDYLRPGAIDYSVIYHIPFLQFGLGAKGTHLRGSIDLGFSPAVLAHDEDKHNLRYLFSEADCTGTAYFVNAAARYFFTRNIFAGLHFEKMVIDADGEEDAIQYPYGAITGYTATVDKRICSDQSLLKISLGVSF